MAPNDVRAHVICSFAHNTPSTLEEMNTGNTDSKTDCTVSRLFKGFYERLPITKVPGAVIS